MNIRLINFFTAKISALGRQRMKLFCLEVHGMCKKLFFVRVTVCAKLIHLFLTHSVPHVCAP